MSGLVCAVALSLLIDTSGSMSQQSYNETIQYHADALKSELVLRAVDQITRQNPIAIRLSQYAVYPVNGRRAHENPTGYIPWTLITNRAEMIEFANRVQIVQRTSGSGSTGTIAALVEEAELFDAAPCEAHRQVIDLATDGFDNVYSFSANAEQSLQLFHMHAAPAVIERGITLNVLPLATTEANRPGISQQDLFNVICQHAIGGWCVTNDHWDDELPQRIRNKLILDITGTFPDSRG